jgi:diguanylate cyclase (GGDEF)-like protein
VVAGLESGADDFLAKPIQPGELLARLRAGARVLALEERLRLQARCDSLTGLLTQRVFFQELDKEWSRAQRRRLSMSCLMLDVDFFKKVNDTYGHPAGDAVLEGVSRALTATCRASDVLCRYGGEEFAILLPETNEDEAMRCAERVRSALQAMTFRVGDRQIQVTASIGAASAAASVRDVKELIDRADQALLAAKQSGRNRSYRYSDLENDNGCLLPGLNEQLDPFRGMLACHVMQSPVACLRMDQTLGDAIQFLCQYRIGSAPVVDVHGKLAGILSEKDGLEVMLSPDAWKSRIGDVMKASVVSYDENVPARKIYDFLCRVTMRRVVVVRDGMPVGVIDRSVLLQWFRNWLQVSGADEGAVAPSPSEDGPRIGMSEMQRTAAALADESERLSRNLAVAAETPDLLVPILVDSTSKMQELLSDLLAQSRPSAAWGGGFDHARVAESEARSAI